MAGKSDQGIVRMANEMLRQLHVNHEVKNWQDINANVFITMFEGLSGESLTGLISPSKSLADEAHNVQQVISMISSDILNTSLSHISGEDIVNGNKVAIANLLEIFSELLEFILDKISSETSSQKDLSEVEDDENDPDRLRGDLIENILNEELSKGYSEASWRKDDDEELNLRLESSGPWWSDEGEVEKHDIRLKKTYPKTVNGSGHTQTRQKSGTENVGSSCMQNGLRGRSHVQNRENSVDDLLNSTDDYIALGRQIGSSNVSDGADNTADLIALGDSLRDDDAHIVEDILGKSAPGPSFPDVLTKFKQPVVSTAPPGLSLPMPSATDRIMTSSLGSSISGGLTVPLNLPGATTEFNDVGVRPGNFDRPRGLEKLGSQSRTDPVPITHHLHHYHHYNKDNTPVAVSSKPYGFSRTHPGNSQTSLSAENAASSLQIPSSSELSRSFENLEKVVEDTVNVSREAVSGNVQTNSIRQENLVMPTHLDKVLSSSSHNTMHEEYYPPASQYASSTRPTYSDLQRRSNRPTTTRDKVLQKKDDCMRLADLTMPDESRKTEMMSNVSRRENQKVSFLKSLAAELKSGRKDGQDKSGRVRQSNWMRDTGTSPIKSLESSASKTKKGTFRKTVTSRQATERSSPGRRTSPKRSAVYSRTAGRTQKIADQLAPPRQSDSRTHKYDHLEHPKSFREYLDKYYGTVERRDQRARSASEDDEQSRYSDSAVDYTPEALQEHRLDGEDGYVSESDDAFYPPPLLKLPPKSVRFEDIIEKKTAGDFADLRRSMRSEDQRARTKKNILDKLYSFELKNFQEDAVDSLNAMSKKAKETERNYQKSIPKPSSSKYKTGRGYTNSSVLLKRSPSRARSRPRTGKVRRRSASASPSVGRNTVSSEGDLLPLLLEEFPFLHLSAETLHDLWRKSTRQLSQLSKAEVDVRRRKSRAQLQIEEAEQRQEILTQIMKKELAHNERVKELKERQQQQQMVKSKVRDKRIQSARGRKYYEEYQIRHRSRMLKKKTKEELLFKKLFQDCLEIQKQRIREMRKYAKDQRSERAEKQQLELESLENYYRDQFEMLAEALAQERSNVHIREKAQTKVLNEMKRQLRDKMEHDIQNFQEQLYRDEDSEYFRQLDADRVRHQVNMANYLARV